MRETILISVGILAVTIVAWIGLHVFKDLSLIRGLQSNSSGGASHSYNPGVISDSGYKATLPPDGVAAATRKRVDPQSDTENTTDGQVNQRAEHNSGVRRESAKTATSDEQTRAQRTEESAIKEGVLAQDQRDPEATKGVLAAHANDSDVSVIQPAEGSDAQAAARPAKLTGLNAVRQEIQQKTDAIIIEQATSAGSDNDHQIPVRLLIDKSCENSPSGVYQTAAGFLTGKAAMTSESIQSLGELIKLYRSCAKSLVVMSHDVRPDAKVSSSVFIRREDEVKYFLIHMGVDRDDIELLERS